jgi:hypothetical protein
MRDGSSSLRIPPAGGLAEGERLRISHDRVQGGLWKTGANRV